MAVTYNFVLRQIALGARMLRGDSTPGLQTSYEDTTLNQWDLIPDGKYPLDSLIDAMLDAEGALANAIADTGGHPWRSYLLAYTSPLTSGDVMPSTDADGNPIIGIYGSVYDGDDASIVCTEQPTEVIRRRLLTSSYWVIPVYYYAMDGNGIIHTRTTVVVQVCFYNRATQLTAVQANNDMLLPDSLVAAIVNGALAMLGIEGNFGAKFENAVQAIRTGLTTVPSVQAGGGATLVNAVSS